MPDEHDATPRIRAQTSDGKSARYTATLYRMANEAEPNPGRAWFDRFHAAFVASDLDAIWALQTRASHELTLASIRDMTESARRDPNVGKALEDRMGCAIGNLEPKQVWEAFTRASCAHTAAGHMVWEFVREEARDDRIVVRLTPGGTRPLPAGMGGELVQVLLREDGEWRLDKPASEEWATS